MLGSLTTQFDGDPVNQLWWVISQSPPAGTQVNAGSAVALTISQGPEGSQTIAVPNVVGMTQSQAAAAITSAGLSVGIITNDQSETVPPGQVISQAPAARRVLVTSEAVILGDGLIGSWQDAQLRLSRCFSGTMDDVRVYTRALNGGQIPKVMTDSDVIILTGAQDIGTAVTGSDSYAGGVYAVVGNGTDIWDRRDGFRYVYRPVTGDFEISARVLSLENTNPWAKAGVMVRETLAPESRHGFMCVTPQGGEGRFAFQCRPVTAGRTTSLHSPRGQVSYPTNTWVKIKRQGNSFTAQTSQDGVVWTNFTGPEVDLQGYPSAPNPVTIDMPQTVYIGLAVTSRSNGRLCTAEFDSILISLHPGVGPEGLLALWALDETSGRIAADSAVAP